MMAVLIARTSIQSLLLMTKDEGKAWRIIGQEIPADALIYSFQENPTKKGYFSVETNLGIFESPDEGKTWTQGVRSISRDQ